MLGGSDHTRLNHVKEAWAVCSRSTRCLVKFSVITTLVPFSLGLVVRIALHFSYIVHFTITRRGLRVPADPEEVWPMRRLQQPESNCMSSDH